MPRGRPAKKAKAEEEPPKEKEALVDVDENTKVAPKRGRGRPPKDKTDTNLGAVNEEQKEVGDEPVVKQAKKKPQESRKVSKISIEFCKS